MRLRYIGKNFNRNTRLVPSRKRYHLLKDNTIDADEADVGHLKATGMFLVVPDKQNMAVPVQVDVQVEVITPPKEKAQDEEVEEGKSAVLEHLFDDLAGSIDYTVLSKSELIELAKGAGLSYTGTKKQLIERLSV